MVKLKIYVTTTFHCHMTLNSSFLPPHTQHTRNVANTSCISSVINQPQHKIEFGNFQTTTIGFTENTIHVHVPYSINKAPYRNAMVAKKLFFQINNPIESSFSFSNIVVTVVNCFYFITGFTEEEVENVTTIVHRDYFNGIDLQSLGCADSSYQLIVIPLPIVQLN